MAIPLVYTIRSVRARWASNVVAVLGIAGVVAVFVAMLAMAKGFQATLVDSGSEGNAIVRRGGASSEMDSIVTLDQLKVISDAPGVAHDLDGTPMVSGEAVVVRAFHHKASGSDALAQVRGVSERSLRIRDTVRIASGRFFRPGLAELVVGKNAAQMYDGLTLGATPMFGGRPWTVVGIMDAGGSAYDSEIWCDLPLLLQTYQRPINIFSTVTVRLTSPSAIGTFQRALASDPRLDLQADSEVEYYAKQSRVLGTLIRVLGFMVATVMGVGAVFGALNTMYSAVASRSREIATLRALGFGGAGVITAFLFESMIIAAAGGVTGCLAALPLNGLTTSTLNWQTFSQVAFAFRVTPGLLGGGFCFALAMGFLGGFLPALRAARLPIAAALRDL
jgi:putative ABC transport system permease protein